MNRRWIPLPFLFLVLILVVIGPWSREVAAAQTQNGFLYVPFNLSEEVDYLDVISSWVDHSSPNYTTTDGKIILFNGGVFDDSCWSMGYNGQGQANCSGPIKSYLDNEDEYGVYAFYNGHAGVDFAVTGDVLAAAGGGIEFVGWPTSTSYRCLGYTVIINHGNNFRTIYGHMRDGSSPFSVGDQVSPGYRIGRVGTTTGCGTSTGLHLHFQVEHWHDSDWHVTDPFGWGSLANDPIGVRSQNLWVGGAPNRYNSPLDAPIAQPTTGRYLGGALIEGYPAGSSSDTTPPTASDFIVSTSGRYSTLTPSGVLDNSGGSGVREVRYSAKWSNEWRGIGDTSTLPYSFSWDMCASGVPNGPIEFGMEVWDNAGNKQVWSELGPNPTSNKAFDCVTVPVEEGVYLYRVTGATGPDWCRVTGDAPSIVSTCGSGWNDQIRSVRVVGEWSSLLYIDEYNGGTSIALDGTDTDLSNNGIGYEASSVKVRRRSPAYFTLYELGDWGGANDFRSDRSIYELADWGYHDRAQSIKVEPGYEVILCVDPDFHGECGRTSNSQTDIGAVNSALRPSHDRATLSSVRVCEGTCPPAPQAPTPYTPGHSTEISPGIEVVFSWFGNGTQYRVAYWAQGGPVTTTGWFSGKQWSAGVLPEAAVPYYWRVQAWNEYGDGGWSTTIPFYVRNTKAYMSPVYNPEQLDSFSLVWSPLSWATDYELQEALSTSLTSDEIWTMGASQRVGLVTAYARTGAHWSQGKYCHRVRGLSATITGSWSDFRCTVANVIYPAETLYEISNPSGASDYTVSWSSLNGLSTYELEETNNDQTQLYRLNTSQKSFTGKATGTWCYRARAASWDYAYFGRWSNTDCIDVGAPPLPPTNVQATDMAYPDQVRVTWDEVDSTHYEVYRADSAGGLRTLLGTALSEFFNNFSAAVGQTYYYWVKACRHTTCSAFSNYDTGTRGVSLGTPTLSIADHLDGDGNFNLSWTTVANASGYALEQQYDNGSWSQSYSGPGLTQAVTGKEAGKWCYRVRATAMATTGTWSNEVCTSVAPSVPVMNPISNEDSDGVFSVSWSSVDYATGYEVHEQQDSGGWSFLQSGTALGLSRNVSYPGTWCYRVRSLYGTNGLIASQWSVPQCTTNWAITGAISIASLGFNAAPGDGHAENPALSDDGRFVAFVSAATNLVPGDIGGSNDIFLRDNQSGLITRVSVGDAGIEANARSYSPAISGNGRYVTYVSWASNLVNSDTNNARDVFVYDRQSATTSRVSISTTGDQANDSTYSRPSVSGDGRIIAFESNASNLVSSDTNARADVFIRDTVSRITTRISVDSSGNQANERSESPAASAGGRFVAFASNATTLVPGDTNGVMDVFVHDLLTKTTVRVSVDSYGVQGNGTSRAPSISADGRYIAFESVASNLVPGDSNSRYDIFVYDAQTGTTSLVSVDNTGVVGNNSSTAPDISNDGRYIAFESSASNLVPGDSNGLSDSFLKDRVSGQLTLVSRQPFSGELGNSNSYSSAIAGNGYMTAFSTSASNLSSSDTNAVMDIILYFRPEVPFLTPIDNPRGTGDFTVSWSSVLGAASYDLQERSGTDPWETVYSSIGTSKALSSRMTGTWCYQVRANSAMGNGPWSGQVCTDVVTLPAIYLSPTGSGTVGIRSFTNADILSYVKASNTWDVLYDGSYVGTPKNIGAFAFQGDDILFGFSAAQVVPGLGATAVPPQDLVRFTATRTGYNNTAGSFAWFFDGSDVGLTTAAEAIDALWIDAAGRLYVSTAGTGVVPANSANPAGAKVNFQDEDVLRFTPAAGSSGATTAGTWALYWNPTAITGMSAEDINGYWEDPATGDRYVTILGSFAVGNAAYGGRFTGNGKTILRFTPNAAAPGGWAPAEKVVWLAPGATFPSNIDGIEMAR